MRKDFLPLVAAVLVLSLQPGLALAYIGPGVGAGAIGAVLGVIGSIFLAIFAVVWYPVKRMMKGRKKAAATESKTKTK
jgi:ammonia channel protein AmtB